MNENIVGAKKEILSAIIKVVSAAADDTPIFEIIKKLDLDEYKELIGAKERLNKLAEEFILMSTSANFDIKKADFLSKFYKFYNVFEDYISAAESIYNKISKTKYVSLAIFNTTETRSLSIQKLITKFDELISAARRSIIEEDYNNLFPKIFSEIGGTKKFKEDIIKFSNEKSNLMTIYMVKSMAAYGDTGITNIIERMKDLELGIVNSSNKKEHRPPETMGEVPIINGLLPATSMLERDKLMKTIKKTGFGIVEINYFKENEKSDEVDFFLSPLIYSVASTELPIGDNVIESTNTMRMLPAAEVKSSKLNDEPMVKVTKGIKEDKYIILESINPNFCRILTKMVYGDENNNYEEKDIKKFAVDKKIAEEYLKWDRPRPAAYNKIIEDEFLSRAQNTKYVYLMDIYTKRKTADVNTGIIRQAVLSSVKEMLRTAKIETLNVPKTLLVSALSSVLFKEEKVDIEYSLTIIRKNRILINDFCREFYHYLSNVNTAAGGPIIGYLEDAASAAFDALDSTPSMWKDAEYSLKEFIMENRFNI